MPVFQTCANSFLLPCLASKEGDMLSDVTGCSSSSSVCPVAIWDSTKYLLVQEHIL